MLFTITYDQKTLTLRAKTIFLSDQVERIEISGRNRSITIQSNRPLLLNKGLTRRRIDWKLVDGQIRNAYVLQMILNTIESYLKGKERYVPKYTKPYKT